MKMINCYLKTLQYILPQLFHQALEPLGFLAAGRETIKANLLLQINSWASIPPTRRQKVQGSMETLRKNKLEIKCSTRIFQGFYRSGLHSKFLANLEDL